MPFLPVGFAAETVDRRVPFQSLRNRLDGESGIILPLVKAPDLLDFVLIRRK
jgi:hypothetical protein